MATADIGIRVYLDDMASPGLLGISRSLGLIPAILAGAPVAFGIIKAAELQAAMALIAINVQGAAARMQDLKNALTDVADASIFSNTEIANGIAKLGTYNFTADQILANNHAMITAFTDLAEATDTQTVPATEALANAMKFFGLGADQATQAANYLDFAFHNGQNDIAGLADALRQVGPVAHVLGVSLQDTTIALALLGQAGLQGAVAGTDLRYMLSALIDPTTKAGNELVKLGLLALDPVTGKIDKLSSKLFDANGNFVGLKQAILDIGGALQHMTPEQKIQALEELFNVRSAQAAQILANNIGQTTTNWNNLQTRLKDTSVVHDAQIRTSTFSGEVKTLWTTLGNLAGAIMTPVIPQLQALASKLNDVAGNLTTFFNNPKNAGSDWIANMDANLANGRQGFNLFGLTTIISIKSWAGFMKDTSGTVMDQFAKAIATGITNAVVWVAGLPGRFFQWLGTSLVSQGWSWGNNFMSSFISGLASKLSDFESMIGNIAQQVSNVWAHHSSPKQGPLRDDDQWMPNMMRMFAQGIESGIPLLQGSVNRAAGGLLPIVPAGAPSSGGAAGRPIQFTINLDGRTIYQSTMAYLRSDLTLNGIGRALR